MFYTVTECAEKLKLSKQSIYNKLKLQEIKPHIHKKQGITYIDDVGFKLIEYSINGFTSVELEQEEDVENKPFHDDLKEDETVDAVDSDFVNYLKSENNRLWEALQRRDDEVTHLSRLVENGQVLLKDKSQDDTALLEGHCSEVDVKLTEVKERMTERKESGQSLFSRLFGGKK